MEKVYIRFFAKNGEQMPERTKRRIQANKSERKFTPQLISLKLQRKRVDKVGSSGPLLHNLTTIFVMHFDYITTSSHVHHGEHFISSNAWYFSRQTGITPSPPDSNMKPLHPFVFFFKGIPAVFAKRFFGPKNFDILSIFILPSTR